MLVQPHQLAEEWPKVVAWVTAAVSVGPGDESALDVLIAIARGQYQLWSEDGLAVVTQVQQYPRQKVLMVLYAGAPEHSGAVGRMRTLLDRERAAFKQMGITKLRVQGPRDWSGQLGTKPYFVAQVDL